MAGPPLSLDDPLVEVRLRLSTLGETSQVLDVEPVAGLRAVGDGELREENVALATPPPRPKYQQAGDNRNPAAT